MAMPLIAALAPLMAAAAPAQAFPRDVSGWLVAERPEACAMGTEFAGAGKTYVAVQKRVNGEVFLSITNAGWSARDGEPYKVSYQLNGREYAEGTTVGYRSGSARGFWSKMGGDFERDLAAGKDLAVFLDGALIRKLSLRGSGAAVAAMNRCVAGLEGPPRVERRRGSGPLPDDPFARAAEPKSGRK